ncbi:hypothetical protein CI102_10979 [Trichoderma harzianum]|nr:hypothetical protein CI102_10979 [Trichoderma harzianum]
MGCTTTLSCMYKHGDGLGDRCVVQIPPILRHLRPCQRREKRNQNGPVENIIFCLPDELAWPISNFHLTAASNTPRLVTSACPLAACFGLACPQPASHLSRCFTPTPSFPSQGCRTTSTSQQLDGTWASLNRPDIGSKSRKGPPLWSLGWSPFLERLPALPKTL